MAEKLMAWVIVAAIAIGLIMWLTGCETTTVRHTRNGYARVTFYNPFERDKIKTGHGRHRHYRWVCFGRRTSSGVRAIEGVTAASNKLPAGTKIAIPALKGLVGNGSYVIQDIGAGDRILREPNWIDIFVDNKQKMKWLATVMPEYLGYTTQ